MFYYEIAIGGGNRGTQDHFTYTSSSEMGIGRIVRVVFRGKSTYGFVVKKSTMPSYKTHAIEEMTPYTIPLHLVSVFNTLCMRYPLSAQQLARLFLPDSTKQYPITEGNMNELLTLPELNSEQAEIVEKMIAHPVNSLLFGDTGTGKTRMYMHIIQSVLHNNKNAVLLEPEIGLSTYMYSELKKYFPQVIEFHSQMTPKQKHIAWQKAHDSKEGLLVIGPRSALTLPLSNIGVIIMDEAHDASYRQDNSPYVYAQDIASLITRSTDKCFFVYGSATPNVADMYFAEQTKTPIYRITTPAVVANTAHTPLTISPKDDTEKSSGHLLLKTSKNVLKKTFRENLQAMILVNRRGTARLVRCESCGHEMACPTCGHLFVYHHDTHRLHCHFCLTRVPLMNSCPECRGTDISMIPYGTKALELEVGKLFPNIRAMRFDTDNARKDHLSQHVGELTNGEIQCIIGTQMVAKGLDLPFLKSLVVLEGSSGNGFMSEERQFQLLYQVLGRAHRGHQSAEIVIQANDTGSPYITHAMNRDYDSFYKPELHERKKYLYPPFCYMMVIHFSRKSSASAQSAGTKLVASIHENYKGIELIGPLPNLTEKVRGDYKWHILIKAKRRSLLADIAQNIGTSWLCELDPLNLP